MTYVNVTASPVQTAELAWVAPGEQTPDGTVEVVGVDEKGKPTKKRVPRFDPQHPDNARHIEAGDLAEYEAPKKEQA